MTLREALRGISGPAKLIVTDGRAVRVKVQQGEVPVADFDALADLILETRHGEIDIELLDGELVRICRSEKQVKVG